MIKCAKFGGSSLASSTQFKKILNIIKKDHEIMYVVVSAPGKENDHDIKMTDALIELATLAIQKKEYALALNNILTRLNKLCSELNVKEQIYETIRKELLERLKVEHHNRYYFIDSIKAYGEECSARILSAFLSKSGVENRYISPFDIGIKLSNQAGSVVIEDITYTNIANSIKQSDTLLIIPGFYGYDQNNKILTFARGGSDLTGAVIAAGVQADIYENFTDVDFVYAASPKIVKNPLPVYELTYKEIRELSYAGFSVLHEETILPLYKRNIPINIKNTNNPDSPGTKIVPRYSKETNFVTGLAGEGGFTSIYLHKYLMNREIGFVRKLLAIFEDEGVPFEHAPSGIDYITIIVDSNLFYAKDHKKICDRISEELEVDFINVIDDLALLMIVGENIIEKKILGRSILTLEKAGINILNTSLAHRGDSLVLGVAQKDLKKGIAVLYDELFILNK